MPHDQRTMYFRLSIIINIVFVLGALFVMMKYQVLFASKSSFSFTSPRTAIFRPAETAQTPGQQQATQSRKIIAGKVIEIKDSNISLEAYGADGSKKAIALSTNESTKYFKLSFSSSPDQSQTAGGLPKQTAIQKADIKVGDFISAVFESEVDINTQTTLTPETINILPPPQVLPK